LPMQFQMFTSSEPKKPASSVETDGFPPNSDPDQLSFFQHAESIASSQMRSYVSSCPYLRCCQRCQPPVPASELLESRFASVDQDASCVVVRRWAIRSTVWFPSESWVAHTRRDALSHLPPEDALPFKWSRSTLLLLLSITQQTVEPQELLQILLYLLHPFSDWIDCLRR